MKLERVKFGDLKEGDLFVFPTIGPMADIQIRTGYWTQDTDEEAMVYRLVFEEDDPPEVDTGIV